MKLIFTNINNLYGIPFEVKEVALEENEQEKAIHLEVLAVSRAQTSINGCFPETNYIKIQRAILPNKNI